MAAYPFPWGLFVDVALAVPGGRRSLTRDAAYMAARIDPPPCVEGIEHIPVTGPVVVAANHYQRRGLWIAWPGVVITLALAQRRGGETPIHWLVTGGLRLAQWQGRGPEVPGSGAILRSVARLYGMTALPLSYKRRRAAALHAWLHAGRRGGALGVFPEGLSGRSEQLREPEPGFTALCRLLHRNAFTVVPVGISERDGILQVRFGPRIAAADCSPEETSEWIMRGIAALLPDVQRGPYDGHRSGRGALE